MKKRIFNNIIYDINNPVEIWRKNLLDQDPLKESKIEIPDIYKHLLTNSELLETDKDEVIKIFEKYNINTPEYFEHKTNNIRNYLIQDKDTFNFPTEILEEYPEYLAGWQTIITNTGLVCFYNSTKPNESNNFVIYDVFDDDTSVDSENDTDDNFLNDIKPDISMLKMYDIFDQPLNVRKINFTDSKFTPERTYIHGNYYAFFNADGVPSSQGLDPQNFFFIFRSKPENFNTIQFNYKPLFVFKIYNTNGTEKDTATIIVDGVTAEKDSNGIYFIDLSARESKDLVSISLQNCGDGYLEVI